VPIITPSRIIKAKSWITSPPRKKRAAAAINTVREVIIVLERTSLILLLMTAGQRFLELRPEIFPYPVVYDHCIGQGITCYGEKPGDDDKIYFLAHKIKDAKDCKDIMECCNRCTDPN